MNWIKMEEDQPEIGSIVLCCDMYNTFISLGRYVDVDDENEFDLMLIDNIEIDSVITHWMPLPKPPEE